MQDEGLHEIQLNGKQLVFLFMAATVVAVVIFLCGVMVGRGVPPERASIADSRQQLELDPTAQQASAGLPVASTGNVPVTAAETLTYPERLEDRNPPPETLKPAAEANVPPLAALAERAPARAPDAAPVVPLDPVLPRAAGAAPVATPVPASNEPAGTGYVVQVAAVTKRAEADAMARRLTTKGYPAFVTTAGANFRVRVGKYDDRRQAEAVAGRLEREEHFKPWITR